MLIAKKYSPYIATAYNDADGSICITLIRDYQFAGGGFYREFTSASEAKRALRGIHYRIAPFSLSDY
jgi:hypothetical protein